MDRRISLGAICSALLLIALVGCTSQSQHQAEPAPQPASSSSTSPSPSPVPTVTTFDAFSYENDPQRVAPINSALQSFGAVILQQDRAHGLWGAFDTYCATPLGSKTTSSEGWTSQGYKPQPGQTCDIQHNPQYGAPAIQVDARVLVGPDGNYTAQTLSAIVSTPACVAVVDYGPSNKVATVSFGPPPNDKTFADVKTLADAQALDKQVIDCLNNTRP